MKRCGELSARWATCPEEKRGLLSEFLERAREDVERLEDCVNYLECERLGRES